MPGTLAGTVTAEFVDAIMINLQTKIHELQCVTVSTRYADVNNRIGQPTAYTRCIIISRCAIYRHSRNDYR